LADGTTLSYGTSGAEFKISTSTSAPTISSEKYIFFGQVDVFLKASPGTGIVSSFILESDDLDEIDWEWLGSTDSSVESNFFGKGNTTTYDRAIYHNVATPIETWHNYSIVWTAESTNWYIDSTLVRTLNYGDALALGGKNYPQTPMRIKMGSWVGCASVAAETNSATEGTCSWAGGAADFTNAASNPFTMLVANVTISDFGCGGNYTYSDMTGDYTSIKSSGTCGGSSNSDSTSGSSTSASATKTTSGGILVQTSASSNSTKASAKTTLSTATGSGSTAKTTSSSTSSSGPSQATSSDGNSMTKHKYGVIDFAVIALGLGLGYLVM
jgi:beta-glucanase (GH16 family)